jgi:chitinase
VIQRAWGVALLAVLPQACGSLSPTSPSIPPTSPSATSTTGWPQQLFAPYIDVTLATPALTQFASDTGSKYFSLAFIVSGSGGCEAEWGGTIPLSQNYMVPEINALRSQGGDVIASFGGAAGTELAAACGTVSSLQSQYQAVIDAYGLVSVDFDVEGGVLTDSAASDRRNKAIAGLQASARNRGRPLRVSFTLPVNPTGLDPVSLDLLRNAVANGVTVDIVNIMTMDYFAGSMDMGQAATQAAQNTFLQIRPLFSGQTDSQLWAMIGITPMIGVNDDTTEVFGLSNAATALSFSQQQKIGFIAFWDVWRDQPCPAAIPQPSDMCSGVSQSPRAFTEIFKAFTQSP